MYTFRIKDESKLSEIIDDVLDNPGLSQQDLKDMGHGWNDIWAVYSLARYSDNFSLSRGGASYTDVAPQTTIIQEAGEVTTQAPAHQPYDGPSVLWPDTPIIGDTGNYSWFRKPSYYDRMEAMIKAGKHIALAGPPGIGKSSAVEYLAAEQGKPLVNISADSGLRRRDLTGNVELVNSHTQFQVALYLAAVKNGWWVKIDEVNAAEPDALMYLNSQIAPPYSANFYGKQVKVHDDFRLFVTYNPGLVGTKPLPPAFKDRFFPIKLDFPTEYQLTKMLQANGMPTDQDDGFFKESYDWTQVVVKYGVEAWASHKNGRMRYQITPRRLMDAIDLVLMADENVFDALDQAVISAVDNYAEEMVLKDLLKNLKDSAINGRLV